VVGAVAAHLGGSDPGRAARAGLVGIGQVDRELVLAEPAGVGVRGTLATTLAPAAATSARTSPVP
jgi:hypothetical protein